jgi:hypothetical protein
MSQQPGGPTEVHSWIGQVFAKFRELELQLLIGELESSLRGGSKERSSLNRLIAPVRGGRMNSG